MIGKSHLATCTPGGGLVVMLTWLLISLITTVASAAEIAGEVIGISDGDTLTVLDAANTHYKVRLAGIDAPEMRQPYGYRSKQYLADLVFRKHVVVEWSKRDRYGRMVGKVLVEGRDACLEQVTAGMAWHFKAYVREQSKDDQTLYAAAEDAARLKRIGLWQDSAPVAPWNFRHKNDSK